MSLGTDALDAQEREGGEIAFAALATQYGAMLDARILVAVWLTSVTLPRVEQFVRVRREKAMEREQRVEVAVNAPPAPR